MARWKGREDFKNRVKHWAEKLDIEVRTLALRPMKNKWASCSTNGNLNFNAELLALDRDVGEYVIVHELLHFVVPHHGKLWKSLMRAHLGDYERLDGKLRATAARAVSRSN
jgi:predicted metal-dependent hydrolase